MLGGGHCEVGVPQTDLGIPTTYIHKAEWLTVYCVSNRGRVILSDQ